VAVYTLSIHAGYRCRHSGACCTAGWRIPVEHDTEQRLVESGFISRGPGTQALERDGRLSVLALTPAGACVFFESTNDGRPATCAIHRVLGHDALPSACRHFPRVAVTDDRGTFVTLSHFCPSAAALLFAPAGTLSIVQPPASFNLTTEYEGLDARGVLPPLLRPGVLMDLDGHHAWQARVIRVMADEAYTPESALARLEHDAEHVRGWKPGDGTLCERISSLDRSPASAPPAEGPQDAALYELVRSCVPPWLDTDPLPHNGDAIDAALVAPVWSTFATPVKRYLAARAFASWIPWHAKDLRISVGWLVAARSVLRVEAVRECGTTGRLLDGTQLVAAVRRADLLLVHKAGAAAVADELQISDAVKKSRAVQA
jgi:Fe-S-cluster containining protein